MEHEKIQQVTLTMEFKAITFLVATPVFQGTCVLTVINHRNYTRP